MPRTYTAVGAVVFKTRGYFRPLLQGNPRTWSTAEVTATPLSRFGVSRQTSHMTPAAANQNAASLYPARDGTRSCHAPDTSARCIVAESHLRHPDRGSLVVRTALAPVRRWVLQPGNSWALEQPQYRVVQESASRIRRSSSSSHARAARGSTPTESAASPQPHPRDRRSRRRRFS